MKKKITALDALWATLFILFLVWLMSLIPLNSDILNPIQKTFSDFKLTDVYYSHIKESPDVSSDIVMVNIGDLPREGIADLVNTINKYDPAVIGIDAFFRSPKDSAGDAALENAFSNTKNLVLVSELHENDITGEIDSISYSHSRFMKHAHPGFADMITKGKYEFKVVRECIPQYEYQHTRRFSFPVEIVRHYKPEAAEAFLTRNNETEDINFQGNIKTFDDNGSSNSKIFLYALDWEDVLNENFEPETIKGKIVIMGYMGSVIGDPSWEDKFFTPLNANYLGKTNPDMFGVVVHANIVAMILKGNFINHTSEYIEYFLSLVFIFLNTWLFAYMFKNTNEWWDGLSMLVTLAEVVVLMSITIFIYHLTGYKFDITLSLVALFLMGNLIEIYFGLILPAIKRVFSKSRLSLQKQAGEVIITTDNKEQTTEKYEI